MIKHLHDKNTPGRGRERADIGTDPEEVKRLEELKRRQRETESQLREKNQPSKK